MHVKPIRSAAPPASPSRLWPAYNLFRCKRSLSLFCAVPEDYPVPAFVDGHGWAFAGKVDEPSAAPLAFEQEPARALVPLTGFYLVTAVWPKQESGSLEPMRLAA